VKNTLNKISILTVAFNGDNLIRDTLISVGRQTHIDIEHIIIVGHSNDITFNIISSFPHVKHVISAPYIGLSEALNIGIFHATGDVIGFLNPGDIYADNRVLEKVASAFKDPDLMSIYGDLQLVKPGTINKVFRHLKSGAYNSHNFYYGWEPASTTFFTRRELFDECGLFNTSFCNSTFYELLLRFLVRYNIASFYFPEVIIRKLILPLPKGSLKEKWLSNREDRKAWDINGLTPYFFTIPFRPFRKLTQFFLKY